MLRVWLAMTTVIIGVWGAAEDILEKKSHSCIVFNVHFLTATKYTTDPSTTHSFLFTTCILYSPIIENQNERKEKTFLRFRNKNFLKFIWIRL